MAFDLLLKVKTHIPEFYNSAGLRYQPMDLLLKNNTSFFLTVPALELIPF